MMREQLIKNRLPKPERDVFDSTLDDQPNEDHRYSDRPSRDRIEVRTIPVTSFKRLSEVKDFVNNLPRPAGATIGWVGRTQNHWVYEIIKPRGNDK